MIPGEEQWAGYLGELGWQLRFALGQYRRDARFIPLRNAEGYLYDLCI
jgi:hypothetical protein